MTYGEIIRAARVAKRMTMRTLAERIGASAPFVCDVEHGRRYMTPDRARRACEVLGIDLERLDRARGLTRELCAWIRDSPDVLALLRDMQREAVTGVRIGGDNCPCRRR